MYALEMEALVAHEEIKTTSAPRADVVRAAIEAAKAARSLCTRHGSLAGVPFSPYRACIAAASAWLAAPSPETAAAAAAAAAVATELVQIRASATTVARPGGSWMRAYERETNRTAAAAARLVSCPRLHVGPIAAAAASFASDARMCHLRAASPTILGGGFEWGPTRSRRRQLWCDASARAPFLAAERNVA